MVFLFTAFLASYFIIYLTIKLAWKIDFLSHPNTIFVTQKKPVAFLGGMAIYLIIAVSVIFNPFFKDNYSSNTSSILLVLLFFTMLGLIDDWTPLKPLTKLIGQITGSILTVYLGFIIEFTTFYFLNCILSSFTLVFTVNAFNLVDVSDGLLSVLFISILLFFYLLSDSNHFLLLIGISVICFLFFNKPEAKIYLGDSGSHLFGVLAYISTVNYFDDSSFNLNNIIPLIIAFSVIIFEFILLLYRRSKQNLSIFKGSPDHFSILLRKASWSKNKIMITALIVNLFFTTLAYMSMPYSIHIKLVLAAFTISIYFLFGYLINKLSNE
jgi:UDP-GlcNAc:undecaprenyl-phosphate GlcNAc-1-phosphate transferase